MSRRPVARARWLAQPQNRAEARKCHQQVSDATTPSSHTQTIPSSPPPLILSPPPQDAISCPSTFARVARFSSGQAHPASSLPSITHPGVPTSWALENRFAPPHRTPPPLLCLPFALGGEAGSGSERGWKPSREPHTVSSRPLPVVRQTYARTLPKDAHPCGCGRCPLPSASLLGYKLVLCRTHPLLYQHCSLNSQTSVVCHAPASPHSRHGFTRTPPLVLYLPPSHRPSTSLPPRHCVPLPLQRQSLTRSPSTHNGRECDRDEGPHHPLHSLGPPAALAPLPPPQNPG